MSHLHDLFEYNQWANSLVLAETDQMSVEALDAPMPELGGSTLELLSHLERVQANFFGLLAGTGRPPRADGRPYGDVAAALRESDEAYLAALPGFEARLAERIEVAWFERSFTFEQALLQVATHSVQHRAGISAGIARAGRKPADLDYIIWLARFR